MRSLYAVGGVAILLGLAAGCGNSSAPMVDPHPLTDSGIPDRVVVQNDAGDARDGAGADGSLVLDGAGSDGTATGDGSAAGDGADGSVTDSAVLPTTVSVSVSDPVEGVLVVASRRFAPMVLVTVTADPSVSDDVKQVDAELWSTGTGAAKVSTTHLALLDRNAGGGDGAAPAGDGGTGVTTFSFGDTPIDLAALTTGSYELRVKATTLAGAIGTATRGFRADAGPVIRIISPAAEQASRGSIFVSVEVTDPFSTTPPVVDISVANIPVTPLTVTGNLYQATVAETIATPPLSGEQLLDVGATNAAGTPARHVVVRFVFDDVGPAITNAKPATGALIGGIVKIEADINDAAGVDSSTVVAVVAHGSNTLEVKLDQDPNDHNHYAHLFDTRRLPNTVLYPTISFRASDIPGNQANIGYTVAVDNTPPLADLDPPADLRLRRLADSGYRCSWRFDPLGTDAIDDGDTLFQLFDIRARVEDQGNQPAAGGADITPLAGLDPAHVELLVLDDTNRALVVDTDGDGLCDAVNPKLVPTTTPMSSQDALLVNLSSIAPAGSANFTADPTWPAAGFPDCYVGNDPQVPLALCRTSDMTVAITQNGNTEPAVWTIPNVVPNTLQCVGNQFDAAGNQVRDGFACLAVHAVDKLGNSQVSRVLHVCIDHDGDGAECPSTPIQWVDGGTPVVITTTSAHGLTTGTRVLLGGLPSLAFDVNGLWRITVINSNQFTLDTSNTPTGGVSPGSGHFMLWTPTSDCTGRQTAINPVVVEDATPCRPWRAYARGEHHDVL